MGSELSRKGKLRVAREAMGGKDFDYHAMSSFALGIARNKNYLHEKGRKGSGQRESWGEVAERLVQNVVKPYMPHLVDRLHTLIERRQFIPGGRYLYAAGRRFPQCSNCFMLKASDSREGNCGWGETMNKATQSLMTGGGIGVVYSDLRGEGANVLGMGGESTGPLALANMVNEAGRYIVQGGSRRSAIWAGLHWNHPDVFKFIVSKRWGDLLKQVKGQDYTFPAPMEGTNISVILDDDFFTAYNTPGWSKEYRNGSSSSTYTVDHEWAVRAYKTTVQGMLRDGEPGFTIDTGGHTGENLRNACTEVSSSDTDDNCNLGSLNLSRFNTIEEFQEATNLATAFLLCGSIYGKLPIPSMYTVREKNRRIGLGLMGVHEWLLRRGYRYGPTEELGDWLDVYQQSGKYAAEYCDRMGISRSVATRAMAPNGTIGIVGETTTCLEPITYIAYKRRYLDKATWKSQYVIDATAKRIIDMGVDPSLIEDSLTLSEDVERRIEMQVWFQRYVDHGISSTINLPPWGSGSNNEGTVERFGKIMMNHLPYLRGITAYPDGARDGQPMKRVDYREALAQAGVEFVENQELACRGGVCGS